MARLIIVSNRVSQPDAAGARAGGLAVALRDALKKNGGIWFGWSGQVTEQPAEELRIVTRGRVTYATADLTPQDHDDYYLGFANSALWPLFHYRLDLFEFNRQHYEGYRRVNAAFAAKLAPLVQPDDIIWVHDYHFIPLGVELRRAGIGNRMGIFLHTPFPATEVMIALPSHDDLMESVCAYDLVGLQTKRDLHAFDDYITREVGGEVLGHRCVRVFDRTLCADAFPISIDTENFATMAAEAAQAEQTRRLVDSLVGRELIIGVDRLDYSKGLVARFEAFERLLAKYPEHRSQVTLMQIAPPSREDIEQYQQIRAALEAAAGRINGHFADLDWMPIRYLNKNFTRRRLAGFYRVSRIGLVTPLRDGMNLVAKEYVAAQDPADPGLLVLSRFAGAAEEFRHSALIVNPYDVEGVADALHRALAMPLAERRDRWQTQMEVLRRNSITQWRDSFMETLERTGEKTAMTARAAS
ncbi:alpha,alpha-trehalose-phosphate synthase (UDP-forming) [Rhodospirillaceae bacterium SYSU D60014]|uniref:alpha,alpha-trehalose-phosphate synthase (UDP-forming) n=1 Tax=Virgifigura deserti TaxID=2268457 RepID=UPI000E65FAAF